MGQASRLAQSLSAFPDSNDAAIAAGIKPDPQLVYLEAEARRLYPDLVAGKIEGIAALATRAIAFSIQSYLDKIHLVAPRDLPFAARNLASVRDMLIGVGGARHGWTDVVVEVPRVVTEEDRPCPPEKLP